MLLIGTRSAIKSLDDKELRRIVGEEGMIGRMGVVVVVVVSVVEFVVAEVTALVAIDDVSGGMVVAELVLVVMTGDPTACNGLD